MAVSDAILLNHLGFATSPFCPEDFHIHDPLLGNYLQFRASQIITAGNLIGDQANVLFGADTEISLVPGFEVGANSIFQIVLDGCSE